MMKYLIPFIMIFSTCILKSQNLHVSSGIYTAGMTIKLNNPQSLSEYSKPSSNFDYLNLVFEKEMSEKLSWKTGIYFIKQKGYYNQDEKFYWQGNESIRTHNYRFSITNIDVPFLITYHFNTQVNTQGRMVRFNLSAGPYAGVGFIVSEQFYSDPEFYPFFYGLDLSGGLGSEKWQLTSYTLKGWNYRQPSHPKVRCTTVGINLTRIIHFKRKS